MSLNPLAGLIIPSADDIAEKIMRWIPNRSIDLGSPIERERLRNFLKKAIQPALMETESALLLSQQKATRHVFSLMNDPGYQKKREHRRMSKKSRDQLQKSKRIIDLAQSRKIGIRGVGDGKESIN